jgi:type I restriction enzyme M protein
MTALEQTQLGKTLWAIADDLRGAMNADDFRDYMLSFLFLRYYQITTKRQLKKNWAKIIHNWMMP